MADLIIKDNAFEVRNGDFYIGDSEPQEVKLLLELEKGELKQHPVSCVGVKTYLNGDGEVADMWREIRAELKKDGFVKIIIDIAKMVIKASR